jgi:hypothetical protein
MRIVFSKSQLLKLAVLVLSVSGLASAQQLPADARGDWTIYSKNIDNNEVVTKHVQIHQNGSQFSGRFEGPNQSGGIQGSVNGNHIEFSTKTREVLTFRGQVDGNTMSGLYGLHGRHAPWNAVRGN